VGTNLFENPFQTLTLLLLVSLLEIKGVQMKWKLPIFAALLLSAGITACSPRLPVPQENTSTPAETVHPLTTRTGLEEIDPILDTSGDVKKLRSLIQFTSTKCTRQGGLGGPPKCLQNEEDGAPVDVLPFLGPEGYFLRKDEIRNWQGFETSGLYAIYEVSSKAFSDENYPAGQYAILFLGQENQPAISLHLSHGRIVRVDYVFDHSPQSLAETLGREAAKLILAPVTR
jgi:hypothetical protein